MLALLLLFAMPAPAEALGIAPRPLIEWRQPDAPEVAALLVMHALITADVVLTLDNCARAGAGVPCEENPWLGPKPSMQRITLLGWVVPVLVTTAVWYALPSRVRLLVPLVIVPFEVAAVRCNALLAADRYGRC